ncbi:MAG: hypothetical protein IJ538_02205 [Clostridia bacterium]|nr:hypothetical protein [Clostridia bacterium]
MKNKKFTNKDLIELLIKRAKGFSYTEEQLEYENFNKNAKNDFKNIKNMSFFDFDGTSAQNSMGLCDKIKIENETEKTRNEISSSLTLSKKKITTHYIPPDMLAIKTLLEIFAKEVEGDEIKQLSNNELIELKSKLLEEIKNDS